MNAQVSSCLGGSAKNPSLWLLKFAGESGAPHDASFTAKDLVTSGFPQALHVWSKNRKNGPKSWGPQGPEACQSTQSFPENVEDGGHEKGIGQDGLN